MSNRKQETYRALFQYIHEAKDLLPLDCEMIMSDYERPMRNGFKLIVPSAEQYACHFHYTQAVKRFAKKIHH